VRNFLHDGEGPYSIGSKTFRKEFFIGRPSSKALANVGTDAGKGKPASTFVNFRQLFRRGWREAKSVDTTGQIGYAAPIRPEAGPEAVFHIFPLFMRQYGDRR